MSNVNCNYYIKYGKNGKSQKMSTSFSLNEDASKTYNRAVQFRKDLNTCSELENLRNQMVDIIRKNEAPIWNRYQPNGNWYIEIEFDEPEVDSLIFEDEAEKVLTELFAEANGDYSLIKEYIRTAGWLFYDDKSLKQFTKCFAFVNGYNDYLEVYETCSVNHYIVFKNNGKSEEETTTWLLDENQSEILKSIYEAGIDPNKSPKWKKFISDRKEQLREEESEVLSNYISDDSWDLEVSIEIPDGVIIKKEKYNSNLNYNENSPVSINASCIHDTSDFCDIIYNWRLDDSYQREDYINKLKEHILNGSSQFFVEKL